MGFVPGIRTVVHKLRPVLLWPSLIRDYQVRPLPYLIGNAPTRGQALYIAMFVILNIVLTAVRYHSRQPSAWYADTYGEIMAYILYRTGKSRNTLRVTAN
jgi:hypothetical protein